MSPYPPAVAIKFVILFYVTYETSASLYTFWLKHARLKQYKGNYSMPYLISMNLHMYSS